MRPPPDGQPPEEDPFDRLRPGRSRKLYDPAADPRHSLRRTQDLELLRQSQLERGEATLVRRLASYYQIPPDMTPQTGLELFTEWGSPFLLGFARLPAEQLGLLAWLTFRAPWPPERRRPLPTLLKAFVTHYQANQNLCDLCALAVPCAGLDHLVVRSGPELAEPAAVRLVLSKDMVPGVKSLAPLLSAETTLTLTITSLVGFLEAFPWSPCTGSL